MSIFNSRPVVHLCSSQYFALRNLASSCNRRKAWGSTYLLLAFTSVPYVAEMDNGPFSTPRKARMSLFSVAKRKPAEPPINPISLKAKFAK